MKVVESTYTINEDIQVCVSSQKNVWGLLDISVKGTSRASCILQFLRISIKRNSLP